MGPASHAHAHTPCKQACIQTAHLPIDSKGIGRHLSYTRHASASAHKPTRVISARHAFMCSRLVHVHLTFCLLGGRYRESQGSTKSGGGGRILSGQGKLRSAFDWPEGLQRFCTHTLLPTLASRPVHTCVTARRGVPHLPEPCVHHRGRGDHGAAAGGHPGKLFIELQIQAFESGVAWHFLLVDWLVYGRDHGAAAGQHPGKLLFKF